MPDPAISVFAHDLGEVFLPGFNGVCTHYHFNVDFYKDSLFKVFQVPFPAVFRSASTGRKAEFLAGRIAAQHAFVKLGLRPQSIAIGNHRCPIWPPAVLASISHHGGHAYCLMTHRPANTESGAGVGVDVETLIQDVGAISIVDKIMSPSEISITSAHFNQANLALPLIFSAKESLFKALYPSVGRYFDFLDIAVSSIDTSRNTITLTLAQDLSMYFLRGQSITAHWQQQHDTVITWVVPEASCSLKSLSSDHQNAYPL